MGYEFSLCGWIRFADFNLVNSYYDNQRVIVFTFLLSA